MNITQLEYFLTASRTLNYTQAANRLFTSRQNLSHAIKELERELGVKLFVQDGGSLALTAEGEEAARRASAILNEVDKLKMAFIAPQNSENPLRVLIGSNIFTFSPYNIDSLISQLPPDNFRIGELTCKECYERVVSERADIALIACMPRDFSGCESLVLHKDWLHLLIGTDSPLAAKEALSFTDLAGYRLQMPPGYEFQFEPLVEAFEKRNMSIENIDPVASFSMVLRNVRRGAALGIGSRAFKDDCPDGTDIRPLAEPGTEMLLYAIYRKETPRAGEIKDFISDVLAVLP